MNTSISYHFVPGMDVPVTCYHPRPSKDKHRAILYFHGGGLLYGSREDLPEPYITRFLEHGYTLYSFGYPLAPESALSEIHQSVFACIAWFLTGEFLHQSFADYFLFGRSAGAYLTLIAANRLVKQPEYPMPQGLLVFYGYYTLDDPSIQNPSPFYGALPAVSQAVVNAIVGTGKVFEGEKGKRYALYVYARQQGCWTQLLGASDDDIRRYALSDEDIGQLPPMFITASSGDQDIPMKFSKNLARYAGSCCTKWVYYLEHDFDRDIHNPTGLDVYQCCVDWMDGLNG